MHSRRLGFAQNAVALASFLACAIMAVALPIVYFMNLPRWLDLATGSQYAPILYILVLAVCFPIAMGHWRKIPTFLKHPYVILCLSLIALQSLTIVRLKLYGSAVHLAEMTQIMERFVLVLAFAFIACALEKKWTDLWIRAACWIVPITILYAFFHPDLFVTAEDGVSTATGRVGAMWQNPNIAGEALLLSLALAFGRFSQTVMMVLYVVIGAAAILTGSRAAMFGWLILGGILVYRKSLPVLVALAPIAMFIFIGPIISWIENVMFDIPEHQRGAENLLARIEFFSSATVDEASEDNRFSLFSNALRACLEQPIFGYGYGYEDQMTESNAGPHNQFLQMWHMYGIAGLIICIGLLWLLFRHAASSQLLNPHLFCFFWISLFSHNVLENNHWYIYLALVFFLGERGRPRRRPKRNLDGGSNRIGPVRTRRKRRKRDMTW